MKVLLINGSPKMERSNSLKLSRAFLGSRSLKIASQMCLPAFASLPSL